MTKYCDSKRFSSHQDTIFNRVISLPNLFQFKANVIHFKSVTWFYKHLRPLPTIKPLLFLLDICLLSWGCSCSGTHVIWTSWNGGDEDFCFVSPMGWTRLTVSTKNGIGTKLSSSAIRLNLYTVTWRRCSMSSLQFTEFRRVNILLFGLCFFCFSVLAQACRHSKILVGTGAWGWWMV